MPGVDFERLVVIGRLVRPQGRHGEIVTESLTDRPDRFEQLRRAFVETEDGSAREVGVARSWPHKGRVVLKLDGVDSIEAAEELRGKRIAIQEQDLAVLPEGSFYFHQLRGLRVVDQQRRPLGVVEQIWETGAAPVLVVKAPAGELLIPFAESFIRAVRLPESELIVSLLESVDAAH